MPNTYIILSRISFLTRKIDLEESFTGSAPTLNKIVIFAHGRVAFRANLKNQQAYSPPFLSFTYRESVGRVGRSSFMSRNQCR